MGHWIRTNRPEVWNALSEAVNAALTDSGRAEAASTEERYRNVPADVTEEFVCDRIGEAMENPSLVRSFASALEARGAGLGRRVLMAVRDFLERVREFFTRGAVNPYVRKYDALSREVGRILAGMERAGGEIGEAAGERRYSVTNYPAFHAWTGDWEDRNIYGKLHGDPVASVENGVIKVEEGERGVIDAAKRWMSQHPQEPAHTEIGDVVIDVNSMQNSMSHSRYNNKLAVLPILKDAMEKGEYLGSLPDWARERWSDHYFATKVRIGNDDKILFIRVLEPEGIRRSLYVHEIYTDDELKKNGDRLVPGMQTGDPVSAKNRSHSDFFRKLIQLFYLSNPESTKAVDSNGRPMVVWRRDDELINVYDFSKTQKTDAGWLGKGFYFYGDKGEAERATGYGKHLRGFYINAKNPYYMSDEEHDFLVNADSKEKSADFTERLLEEGYDSVYYNGDLRQEWVVFEPSQIKLADETTYDDNGSPIPSYMRFSESDDNRYSITNNPDFRKWFGNSKVVDEDGEPLVVYRGASFNPLEQPDGKGVIKPMSYFSADPGYAKRYGGVQAYYLRIEHPFDIRNPECRKDLESVYPGVKFARGRSGALDWAEASTVDNEFLEENFPGKYDGIIFDEASDWADDGKTPKWRGISYVPPCGGEG